MSQTDVSVKPYKYFDSPDGQDIFKKLWCVVKPTAAVAAGAGIVDVMAVTYPKGYAATAVRFTAVSLPIIGIASTFVLVTNSITNIRQKDDRLNWFLGGFATGCACGLWKRHIMLGFNMGMFFGILGFLRKEALIHGWDVVPTDRPIRRGGATSCLADFSWTAERPRGWTTGQE